VFKPQKGQLFVVFLTLLMYPSDPLWKKKVFDFNYIITVGISLLNYAKFKSKYDTRYFQSLITINKYTLKKRQTLKTAHHCGLI
jgi:hypothetical protein